MTAAQSTAAAQPTGDRANEGTQTARRNERRARGETMRAQRATMGSRFWGGWFWGLLLGAAGCATGAGLGPAAPNALEGTNAAALQPLAAELRVDAARGRVLAARAGQAGFLPLAVGETAAGVSALRASGGAAGLTLREAGETLGRLWLQDGTELQFGSGADLRTRLAVRRGTARISLFSDNFDVALQTAGGAVEPALTGRDVLIWRTESESAPRIAETAQRLAEAEWTFALDSGPEAGGLGSMEARGNAGSPVFLSLAEVHVSAQPVGDMVATSVEHVFANPSKERLEGTFRFPLPDGALPTGLALEIDGRLVEGEIVERDKARETYESIVADMRDPALLEWEAGQQFSLRVFPIEPESTKRVVLRFLAPLRRSPRGSEFVYPTVAADMQTRVERFRLTFDGRPVVDERDFTPGRDVVVPLARSRQPRVIREDRADGQYISARIRPDWDAIGAQPARRDQPRHVVVVLDTSRSALESYELGVEALAALGAVMRPRDRVLVTACDIACRDVAADFLRADAAGLERVRAFARAQEPDGASDLRALIAHVGETLRTLPPEAREQAHVVYVGDGTATWGELDTATLARAVAEEFAGTPLSVLALGRRVETARLQRLSAETGGRFARPRTQADVRRFAAEWALLATAPRLTDARVTADNGAAVLPAVATTLFEGDEFVAYLRTAGDATRPTTLILEGRVGTRVVRERLALDSAVEAPLVAQRWAAAQIEALPDAEESRSDVVALSREYGVLSRHTAFLVLENDEAYRRHGIERRAAGDAADPRVSGGDLESVAEPRASLSPDEIQPGDPEIRIPAPADARAVIVLLPFGETKRAVWEPELGLWTARFLVSKDTPDGHYTVVVRITHADGTAEVLTLAYDVDTEAPQFDVRLRARPGRRLRYDVVAQQRARTLPRVAVAGTPEMRTTAEPGAARPVELVPDARRVELRMPDGQALVLRPLSGGRFAGRWTPREAPVGPVELQLFAFDRALNPATATLRVEPEGGAR